SSPLEGRERCSSPLKGRERCSSPFKGEAGRGMGHVFHVKSVSAAIWQLGYYPLMEKRTPNYKLAVLKALVEVEKVGTTHAARTGASELGLEFSDMLDVVMALTPADFHKSMTTYANHSVWQDVYRPSTKVGDVYLKLTVIDEVLIVSFREL
ncbi:MAG: type II toxin-antitoxin system MqsR family toxin, partial [Rhodocyclaceae bacterium]|nr:type II toxin-antitoxin system MqsR family toxin [Rhodocyclaceae bacterium]